MRINTGMSLLEVLISLVLLSFIVVQLDLIYWVSLKKAEKTYYFSVAERQIQSMAERLRLIDQDEINQEIVKWNQQNQSVLPHARGDFEYHHGFATLSLAWGNQGDVQCSPLKIEAGLCLRWNYYDIKN